LEPIFKAEEAITKAFSIQYTRKCNSTGMERQITVNQVYKLTELRSFNQELENKEAHDDQDQQDTVQNTEEDHSPTTSTSNKKQKI
jgi:hypothetical protein